MKRGKLAPSLNTRSFKSVTDSFTRLTRGGEAGGVSLKAKTQSPTGLKQE